MTDLRRRTLGETPLYPHFQEAHHKIEEIKWILTFEERSESCVPLISSLADIVWETPLNLSSKQRLHAYSYIHLSLIMLQQKSESSGGIVHLRAYFDAAISKTGLMCHQINLGMHLSKSEKAGIAGPSCQYLLTTIERATGESNGLVYETSLECHTAEMKARASKKYSYLKMKIIPNMRDIL